MLFDHFEEGTILKEGGEASHPWMKLCYRGKEVLISNKDLHSIKPELRFSAGSTCAHSVLKIRHGENL